MMAEDDISSPSKKFRPSYSHPREELLAIANSNGLSVDSEEFAKLMDKEDPIRELRNDFHYPKMKDLIGTDLSIVNPDDDCVYFCGNSLGLCPKKTKTYMDIELDKWAKLGVQGHRNGDLPWALWDECLEKDMAKLVGAEDGEIAIMNGLTINLHLLMISFYRPTPTRHKILCEGKAFPSDHAVLNDPVIKITEAKDVRWLSHDKAVQSVRICLSSIITSLEREAQERNDSQAMGLSVFIQTYNFVATLHMMSDILPVLSRLSKAMQKKDLDYSVISPLISGTKATISALKELPSHHFSSLQEKMSELVASPFKFKMPSEKEITDFKNNYAFESQLRLHGYDPKTSLICIHPREGEELIRTEDILATIEKEGGSIAVVCIGGVQYYTGQVMEMEKITKAGQAKGCYVGFDLAHAVGNVELHLHDWGMDFACWCTYKYLNSSAGCLAAIFLHKKHEKNDFPKLQGWWSHKMETRFEMDNCMDASIGAHGYRVTNPAGLLAPPIKASLESPAGETDRWILLKLHTKEAYEETQLGIEYGVKRSTTKVFGKTSMKALRTKSKLLTGYLEYLVEQKYGSRCNGEPVNSEKFDNSVDDYKHLRVRLLTPSNPEHRGAQLSFMFSINIKYVFQELQKRGVVCDERMPSVIRIAPAPLYCSFYDVYRFMGLLDDALKAAEVTAEQHNTTK